MTYDEIHSYIHEYISTYRPTFSVSATRESKDQIGMAIGALLTAVTVKTKHCSRKVSSVKGLSLRGI